ncbi:CapA family protein [Fulvivirgaceae bacterium BMA10]|uniref:CapA family protein n=1 Tax=Splendidivirga corallicola TaxID=3051826 RepID=A0ABT8KGD4_9BACT|nr:CapA family protein [Fulvivirgaceae bacterium BMA10]
MSLKRFFLIIFALLGFSACKVSKVATSSTSGQPQDTVVTKIDSSAILPKPIYVTVKGDTLESLDSVVEINVQRLIKDTLSFVGVGDIMMGTNYPNEHYLPPNQGKSLLEEAAELLKDADVTFGNLEGVILNEGGTPKYCKNPKVCYLFRSPEYMVSNLKAVGFDVVSLANNHAGDFGDEGRRNTMRILDSLSIQHAGQEAKPYATFMIEGMKYGFAAFAPNTGTISINDIPRAKAIIAHLDSISDVVIASFHGGAEGSKHQHVTRETEIFYGENRGNVYEFAHELIDSGADIIFGHGPHVSRAVEVYKQRFIAYSLGNFCTYARFNLKGDNGLAPLIKVFTNSKGEFLYGRISPFVQKGAGWPVHDPDNRVIERIRQLTTEDFPESVISIDDGGFIRYIVR